MISIYTHYLNALELPKAWVLLSPGLPQPRDIPPPTDPHSPLLSPAMVTSDSRRSSLPETSWMIPTVLAISAEAGSTPPAEGIENTPLNDGAAHNSGAEQEREIVEADSTPPGEGTETAPLNEGGTYSTLSDRELQIVELVADGLTNQEISQQLEISKRTVDNHVSNILTKTKTGNRVALVRWALQWGKVCIDDVNCCVLPSARSPLPASGEQNPG